MLSDVLEHISHFSHNISSVAEERLEVAEDCHFSEKNIWFHIIYWLK